MSKRCFKGQHGSFLVLYFLHFRQRLGQFACHQKVSSSKYSLVFCRQAHYPRTY